MVQRIGSLVRRYFYVLIGVVAIVIVHIGFSRTYITPVLSGAFTGRKILHLHGAVFLGWLVISTVQPFLITRQKLDLHKKLGVFGFILAGVLTLFGLYIGISTVHISIDRGAVQTAKEFLIVPITDMMLFATFAVLAMLNVKNPEAHKRFIVLTALAILPAATARTFPLFSWWTNNEIIDTILALLIMEVTLYIAIIFDLTTRKKVHPAYIWGGLSLILIHTFREYAAKSEIWISIANWILKHT